MKYTREQMSEIYDEIEQSFIDRFNTPGAPKKGTKAYEKQKCEFFAGAMNGILATLKQDKTATQEEINTAAMPVVWAINLLSGRSLKCEEKIYKV